MKTYTLDLPTLYGDHHVIEVRRILLAQPGVQDVYASSAFQVVEVTYDPDQVTEAQIDTLLAEAGYAGELEIAVEASRSGYLQEDVTTYFRQTASHTMTHESVSFNQSPGFSGRPLWSCPGIAVIKTEMED